MLSISARGAADYGSGALARALALFIPRNVPLFVSGNFSGSVYMGSPKNGG